MSKKVKQSASAEVTFVTSDPVATQRALRGLIERGASWATRVDARHAAKHRNFTVFTAVVTYTAVGANRDDINRRVHALIPAEAIIVSSRAAIKKLAD